MGSGTHTLQLEPGSRIVVRDPRHGGGRTLIVVQVKDGLVWISGCSRPGDADALVELDHTVPGDATYRAPARVVFVPPQSWALRRIGCWQRLQRRDDFRMATPGLCVNVVREGSDGPLPLPLVDLSAGGLAAWSRSRLRVGEAVRCLLDLPDAGHFEIRARVVRVLPSRRAGWRTRVALQFQELAEADRTRLLRWLYREQTRRRA